MDELAAPEKPGEFPPKFRRKDWQIKFLTGRGVHVDSPTFQPLTALHVPEVTFEKRWFGFCGAIRRQECIFFRIINGEGKGRFEAVDPYPWCPSNGAVPGPGESRFDKVFIRSAILRKESSSCSSGVERILGKDEVMGSIPIKSSSHK